MTRALIAVCAVLALAGAAAAQPSAPAAAPDTRALDPANTLLIETTKGRIVVEMLPQIAPLAVQRIKTLARRGDYDGALFYRVLKDYMAQTGDKGARTFRSNLPDLKAEFTFTPSPDIPFVSIGDIPGGEVGFIGAEPVTVMAAAAGKPAQGFAKFCPGTAAMPHYDNPDSANSQLFFMRQPSPPLEKTFTAWGRVVAGLDVVRTIKDGEPPADPDKMTRVRVLADLPAAERPDVRLLDPRGPTLLARVQAAVKTAGPRFSLCDLDLSVPASP